MSKYVLVERTTGRVIQPGEMINVKHSNIEVDFFIIYRCITETGRWIIGNDAINVGEGNYALHNPAYQIIEVPDE